MNGIKPWMWVVAIIAVVVLVGGGLVSDIVGSVIDTGSALLGYGALALVVVGALCAIVGLLLRMTKHQVTHAHGTHMLKHGVIAVAGGAIILAGGLTVIYSVGSMATTSVRAQIERRMQLPAAPAALTVKVPTIQQAPGATPTPVPMAQHP